MKNKSTGDRIIFLLTIIPFLLENGATPIKVLAEKFDFEEREIKRLAEFLGTAGIPGETKSYQHEDLFDINWDALLDRDELEIVQTVAVDDTPNFSASEISALIAGLNILDSILPEVNKPNIQSLRKKLASGRPQLQVAMSDARDENPAEEVSTLVEYIEERKQIELVYQSRNGEITTRSVDPHKLTQFAGQWYLHGYCHLREAYRVFRLEDIKSIHKTNEIVKTDSSVRSVYEFKTETLSTAVVAVEPEYAYLLDHWRPKSLTLQLDGRPTYQIDLIHPTNIMNLITIAPGKIEVISPVELRQLVNSALTSKINFFR